MDEGELGKLQEALVNTLIRLRSAYGKSISKLHLTGRLPVEVRRLLTRFFNLFDESCQAYISCHHRNSDNKAFSRISCRMGCSYCCYHMPYGVSCLEYLYLYDGICRTAPYKLFLPALIDRNEMLSSVACNLIESNKTLSDKNILEDYSKKMIPCPFLDNTSKLCLIYSFRPLICRMHVSFAPPRFCSPLHQEPWRCGGINIEPSDILKEEIEKVGELFPGHLSQFLTIGIVQFMVNVMRCRPIRWG